MPKVLIVATSRKTRGGITSVVKAHEAGKQWQSYNCCWIETHQDKSFIKKFVIVFWAFFKYIFLLPCYDMVHIHVGEAPSALRKLPFAIFAKVLKKKMIVHFHSFSPDTTIKGKYSFLYKHLFKNADKVIVLSEYWKKEVNNAFSDIKLQVIYNPCLREIKNKSIGSADYNGPILKKRSILYAGTINQRKGYKDMIRAFAKIISESPKGRYKDWQLVFAGNGEIEIGKKLAKELGIESQTKWLGWVTGAEKDRAFHDATMFCLPSYAEGFPMSVLDAWSYGLPVITTPVGGIPDVAQPRENMLLFLPGDIDNLAQCMKWMMDDSELRKKISIASTRLAQTIFNIDTINKQIEELYAEVLSQ